MSCGKKVYRISAQARKTKDGLAYKNCLASYVHLHFASNPELATSIVKAAARCKISTEAGEMKITQRRNRRQAMRRGADAKVSSKQ
jgi:CobQ-like glutamine amidotransferase family enzyme